MRTGRTGKGRDHCKMVGLDSLCLDQIRVQLHRAQRPYTLPMPSACPRHVKPPPRRHTLAAQRRGTADTAPCASPACPGPARAPLSVRVIKERERKTAGRGLTDTMLDALAHARMHSYTHSNLVDAVLHTHYGPLVPRIPHQER
jgi:hypothetical protein